MSKVIIKFFIVGIFIISVFFYRYGRSYNEKLGETTFLKNEMIELRLITRYEYLPLHYSGDTYSVVCKTKQTKNFKAKSNLYIEQGWNTIPSIALNCSVDDKIKCDHRKLSEEAKKYFYFFDRSSIVSISDYGVYVSFNGCQEFAYWDIALLINELKVIHSSDFKKCQENLIKERNQGIPNTMNINCFYLNFIGGNKLVFSNVNASDKGRISFFVTSKAFRRGEVSYVESLDFGKTWNFKTIKKDF